MSLAWEHLPRDSAALLNPALLAVLVERAVRGAVQEGHDGLPWELAYLLVPMSLDAETRKSLPMRINSPLVSWVANNSEVRSLLPRKISSMSGLVGESLHLGLSLNLLSLDRHLIREGSHTMPKTLKAGTNEVGEIHKAAHFLGRWLTSYPSSAGLYSLFGVQP